VFTDGKLYVGICRVTSVCDIKEIWEEEKEEAKR
jgi:hypothetical protein